MYHVTLSKCSRSKVKNVFLVNASPSILLDEATSNFAGA